MQSLFVGCTHLDKRHVVPLAHTIDTNAPAIPISSIHYNLNSHQHLNSVCYNDDDDDDDDFAGYQVAVGCKYDCLPHILAHDFHWKGLSFFAMAGLHGCLAIKMCIFGM